MPSLRDRFRSLTFALPLIAGLTVVVAQSVKMLTPHSDVEAEVSTALIADPDQNPTEWVKTPRSPAYSGDPVKARDDWFYYQRAYPLDVIPKDARLKALRQAESLPVFDRGRGLISVASAANTTDPWVDQGANTFTSTIEPTWGRMSGRVRSLAIDPTNPQRLFLGVSSGGVWRSTNGGGSWTPLTNNEDSQSIGAVAIDPTNTNTIYAGTGEGNGQYYGVGILKSTDGGSTWTKIGTQFARNNIVKIHVDPSNGSKLVVCARSGELLKAPALPATSGGVFTSSDGGATFTARTTNSACAELAIVASSPQTMFYSETSAGASGVGLYKSTDGGVTWTRLANTPVPVNNGTGRLGIGLSADGATLYTGGNTASGVEIHKSTNANLAAASITFTKLTPTQNAGVGGAKVGNTAMDAPVARYCSAQCYYNNVITVNPTNANDVWLGGVSLHRSTDGGASFTPYGSDNAGGGPLHVDHHVLMYESAAKTSTIYSGNDGGLYKSTDGGATWKAINTNLQTIQPYHLSLHPTDPGIFFTGNQDNGSTRREGSNTSWVERGGGDGSYSAFDPTNGNNVWISASEAGLSKSTDGGTTFVNGNFDKGADRTNFISPIEHDPTTTGILYVGTYRLHKTTNGGGTWAPVSGDLTGGGEETITNISVAPSNTSVVWATTTDGRVSRCTGGGTTCTNTTKAPLPGRYATSVAADSTSDQIAVVGFSAFNDTTPGSPGHVFRTTDGGTTWTNISGNLPDAPVNSVEIRPGVPAEIYAGTDVGVFVTTNTGASWAKAGVGIPNVGISYLVAQTSTNTLAAATYGRGVFTRSLSGVTQTGPEMGVERLPATPIADGGPDALGARPLGNNSLSYRVRNTGTTTLNVTGVQATNLTNVTGFAVGTTLPLAIPAGDSGTVAISFSVTSAGAFSLALQIANNDSDENPYDINISGTGATTATAPDIGVKDSGGMEIQDGGSDSLGNKTGRRRAIGGFPVSITYTIENTGNAPLIVYDVFEYDLQNVANLYITSPLPLTIPVGGSGDLDFDFDILALGDFSLDLDIGNNDPDEDPFDIAILGVAVLDDSTTSIPTLSDWMVLGFGGLLALVGVAVLRRHLGA